MNVFDFPNQRIPEKQKDENWHKSHIEAFLTYSGTTDYNKKKKEMSELILAAAGEMSDEQNKIVCKTITERYGENFGPQYYIYPLIENTIESIVSEYRTRPLLKKLLVNNEKAVIKKLNQKVNILAEKMLREVNQEMQSALGFVPETEQPEMEIPEDLEEFFQKDYRTISEEIGEDILYQLLVVRKEKEKIYDMLRMYLTVGRIFAVIDKKDGHPTWQLPHILDTFCDIDDSDPIQRDPDYFLYELPMSINEIYNNFSLSEDEKKIIQNYSKIMNSNVAKYQKYFIGEGDDFRPRVIFMEWKSRISRKFLIIKNEKTGEEEQKILPVDYKVRNRDKENIKEIEIDDVRHCVMVGPEIVLSFGSLTDQMRTIGNPKKRFLNVVGLVDDVRNKAYVIRSLAKKLKYLQDFASEILYEIRINARQIDGSVLVYDLANIPKEFLALGHTRALEKVHYYLKRDRVQYINSKDRKQNTYAGSANVSQKGRLDDLIALLALIEDLANKISGVSKEAQGQASQYNKATTTEANMTASSIRMESYLGPFDTFVEILQERTILKSKFIYKENDVFTYFAGDNQAKFLKLFPDFFLEDLGIHTADNRKEMERKKKIEAIAERAFGQSQDLNVMLNLIGVYNADHSTEAEAILRRGVKKLNEINQQNMQIQQEQFAAEQQAKMADIAKKDEQHDKKLVNNLEVAEIYARQQDEDTKTKETNANLRKAAELENAQLLKELDKRIKDN